jgi:hypothetical protein
MTMLYFILFVVVPLFCVMAFFIRPLGRCVICGKQVLALHRAYGTVGKFHHWCWRKHLEKVFFFKEKNDSHV